MELPPANATGGDGRECCLSDSSSFRSGRRSIHRETQALRLALVLASAVSGCDGTLSGGVPAARSEAPVASEPAGGDEASASGAALPLDGRPIFSQLVRLTHQQWEQSVRDVLRLDDLPGLSESFTGDPPEGIFSNDERGLLVTPNLSLDYQRAAEQLAQRVARDAQALSRLDGFGDPAGFIQALGRRVYRRPLTAAEQQRYQSLFAVGPMALGSGDGFADGAQLVVEAMLQSPYFVYRTELEEDGEPLNSYELASKLSFLLRNTTPDDDLLDAAASGEFEMLDGIVARARRMLDEPAASAVAARFHSELFGLERYSAIAKDPQRFPQYSTSVNPALQQAEALFLNNLFQDGQGLAELLTSKIGFVNAETAPLYGLEAAGGDFQAVDLGPERPGLFTRLGFLAYNGTLRDPDSIHRGVEINRVMLCARLQPPPGIIPALPSIKPDQTNRERVSAHTGVGTCGESCHGTLINPIGFAFENFDALGQLRDTDNGKPVDTSGAYQFSDGLESFRGAPELMQLLATNPQVHACFAEHLMQFTLGRDLVEDDRALVDELDRSSLRTGTSTKELLLAIVAAPSFSRRPTAATRGAAQ